MTNSTGSTETLDSLLRGEISAIETYSQAIHKFPESPFFSDLHSMRSEHQNNVAVLRKLITRDDGDPPTSSGAWGAFAKAVEGTAAALSPALALRALLEGELHGIREYESALGKEDVPAAAKAAIQEQFLPALRQHVQSLEGLIAAA